MKPTTTALAPMPTARLALELADVARLGASRPELAGQVAHFANRARAESTERVYRGQVTKWAAWCDAHGVASFPASSAAVAGYLSDLAVSGCSASTVRVAASALRWHHSEGARATGAGDLADPTAAAEVREVLAGLAREIGKVKRVRRARPAMPTDLRAMVAANAGDGLLALRDRAVLLLGFTGAFRRSELVALDLADLEEAEEGLRVTVRRSKADQLARGAVVGIPRGEGPMCPVVALRAWLAAAGAVEGPVFRVVRGGKATDERMSGRAVARMMKRLAVSVGADPARFSGHSLRRGLATAAAESGADVLAIQKQGRWASADMPARYASEANVFKVNAARGLL